MRTVHPPAREWICFTFDEEAKLRERAVHFGLFTEAARQINIEADSERRGYPLSCALIISPNLDPEQVKLVTSDILSLRLPDSLTRYLGVYNRSVWTWGGA